MEMNTLKEQIICILKESNESNIMETKTQKGCVAFKKHRPEKKEERWIQLFADTDFTPPLYHIFWGIGYLLPEKMGASGRNGGSLEFALLFFKRLMIDCVDFEDLPDLREDPIYGDNS